MVTTSCATYVCVLIILLKLYFKVGINKITKIISSHFTFTIYAIYMVKLNRVIFSVSTLHTAADLYTTCMARLYVVRMYCRTYTKFEPSP